jgi:hypothetical protein
VQVMGAVTAMQAAWHDTQNSTGSISARPCKPRKDGAPAVPEREGKPRKAGPPLVFRVEMNCDRPYSPPEL